MDIQLIALFTAPATALLALGYGIYLSRAVLKESEGSEKLQTIAKAVREGAMAYLKRQFKVVFPIMGVLAIMIVIFLNVGMAVTFLLGAVFSAIIGYLGMWIAVRANVRTANNAQKGLNRALGIAFGAGTVNGMLVVGLGLLGVSIIYIWSYFQYIEMGPNVVAKHATEVLVGYGFGAALLALFMRVGGGIFTKAADVGADLVGKVEKGIPEDDPRNPATIADNVGDNVGDCAGMAADLFETYVVTVVATMVLASIYFAGGGERVMEMMLYPLAIGATCVITSIIGTFFVRLGKSQSIMGALYKGVLATGVLSLILLWPLTAWLVGMDTVMTVGQVSFTGTSLFFCGVVGLVITALIVVITEYYTGTNYRPVQSIAKASLTGHGTNVIQGLAVSLESTALPALVIMAGIIITYGLAGLFGIAIAVTTMLALAGMIVALDAFGPVTDNAGGIAEMAGLPKEVRKATDALDAVGNTTKAVTKGYAIGSAGLGALVLFAAYTSDLDYFIRQGLIKVPSIDF